MRFIIRTLSNRIIVFVRNCTVIILCVLITSAISCTRKGEKKYHCPDAGFSITFPEKWKVAENLKGTRILAEIPEEEGISVIKQNVNVVVDDVKEPVSLKEYMDLQIKGLQRLKGMKLFSSGEASIQGAPARWCVYSYTLNDFGYKALVYVLKRKDRYYILTGISQLENYNKYEKAFQRIAESLSLY